ncbi:MAG TPA: uracil-DNA glycosylase [Armatimonadota bacterium]|jgi:uracil-DNA glycosylase family 4|nr:uracil-DNA glycosylase [Armatimonadota bacterium]HPP74728.1 uracil-DNA glycosylase [Armatimonadota bacterium]
MTIERASVIEEIEQLRLSALTCDKCELAQTRTNVVFGDGNPDTPLVIIGEGPGENEDATGKPFVGRAGALLDQVLRENGLTRKHVYITNVIKCRACISEGGRTRNRPPRTSEMAACIPWLERQLEIIQPLVILCLGAPAANTIIHKDFRMTQERGRFFETKYARYAIAALHPAYVLRQDGEMYDQTRTSLVADIAAARRKVIEARKEPKPTLF